MSTGENIKNAIQVLYKTYESVEKMMEQCRTISEDAGYVLMSDKFLRWRSDSNSGGWLVNSVILLFQHQSASECDSGNHWRNGPVYVVEICLGVKSEPERLPELLVSKFEYKNIEEWYEGCSPANHWVFHQPLHKEKAGSFTMQEVGAFTVYTPNSEKVSDSYWGMERAVSVAFPLIDITSDNLRDKVFGTFDRLSEESSHN